MTRTTKKAAAKLNTAIAGAVKRFAPPESLTVDEWADKHRRLSPESSAEAGPWRTKRTPYLEEPMRAFTDPKVHKIVMVAASQVGKSELELNIIGYIIDQDPGSILYVHPTIDDARKFSRLRVAPMIRDSKPLKAKVHDVKAKDSGNTILQKSFPGGMLTLTGSNSASALASTPARYIIGDERDRWPKHVRPHSTTPRRSRSPPRPSRATATSKRVFTKARRNAGATAAPSAGSTARSCSTISTSTRRSRGSAGKSRGASRAASRGAARRAAA